ncbi:MAG: DMT family transporter [Litorivicinus sp.]
MTRAWILLVCLALMWGTSFAAMSQALAGFDPLGLTAARLVLASGVLLVLACVMRVGFPLTQAWWQYAGIALLGNSVPFGLIAWGQLSVSSAVAGAIMGTMPIVTAAIAMGFGIDRLSSRQWAGLAVGFVGLLVLARGQSQFSGTLLGAVAVFAAVVCYALSTIIAKKGPDKDSIRAGFATTVMAALISTLAWGWGGHSLPAISDASWWYILYLGVFPSALAMVCYFTVVRIAGPVFLSQVNYMVPVMAFGIGAVFLREPIFTELPLAIGLILAGLFLASRVVRR